MAGGKGQPGNGVEIKIEKLSKDRETPLWAIISAKCFICKMEIMPTSLDDSRD